MSKTYKIEDVKIPILPIRGIWILPDISISVDIGREYSQKAVEIAYENDVNILLLAQKNFQQEEISEEDLNEYGILSKVRQMIKLPDGNYRAIIDGISRAKTNEIYIKNGCFEALAENYIYQDDEISVEFEALKRLSIDYLKEIISYKPEIPEETIFNLELIEDKSKFSDTLVSYINLSLDKIQKIVEELDVFKRLKNILAFMDSEIEILSIRNKISNEVKKRLDKSQKEYFLREQLQVIREELEDTDGIGLSYEEKYKEKIESLPISDEYKDHLLKELSRLEYIVGASPESNIIRTYLDNVFDIPFGKYSDDEINIKKSRAVLDKDHHGLDDVKERILEFLAVRKLKKDMKGSILCLVGPPGVGKTSIVKSVAESMNREYLSMRLGGMSDESEIRGHRKTYIGAMPGRIISLLQRGNTMNPVILLDEIDKVSADYRADPASALLEVLDPNQNDEFIDRYIEIPVDLSNVMFVTTANTISTIPRALLDRMEVIEISGYTEYDKLIIAKKYLVPKQLKEHGLKASQVSISDSVLNIIIKNYTRESGVRNLERQIAKILRKAAMKIIEGSEKINVSLKNFRDFLGREKILDDDISKQAQVGVVTGLAWTQVGGEILQIEANIMKGKGKLQLTGSLGDVMKESAMTALSLIRANQEELKISDDFFENHDIHVHVPEGATPKDGPSAGITMTCAIVSAITDKKVQQDIAMTGEVTLRGRVLPIGGLKEKVLAARRYGIKNIIIPNQNERDLDDIPKEALKDMKFYPVSKIDEVIKLAILDGVKNENN